MSASASHVQEQKRRSARLMPDENSFYVGRDSDGRLFMFETRPTWSGFDFSAGFPDEQVIRLADEWFRDLEPGCCVKVGPYGYVIDCRDEGASS